MSFDPNKITFFAETDARGKRVPFGIKAQDRQRHMYVIGKTGMGKSTLLENMAAQDIMNGEGMAFIDPHGSAIEALLNYVPEHRLDDVVYFAPFDMENPISFNVMEDVGPDKRHLVVSGLMSTFKKIWVDAWSARMEYILTNALLALIEYPNTTLLSVNRMLADAKYREKVVDHIKDPAVKAYWVDEFANYTERFAAEALPAIQNKIGQFTGNPLIRNIIGQPKSSFDIRQMMDEKKILLVNLSKGLVGETNADLLGSMLTTRIYLAAMSRANLSPQEMKQMPNFYFYVDEFQSFANATFANILSEARKYHLNLIIAHQYIEQMEEDVRNAVFGNVGTTVAFRVGPFDAEHLEKIFEPRFMANDLVNIGPYQIYLTLMIDGAGSQPFSAATLPPVESPPQSHRNMVIARSRTNYAKPREEVEKIVTDLHTPEERADMSAEGKGGNKGAFTNPAFGQKVGQPPRGKKPAKKAPERNHESRPRAAAGSKDRPPRESSAPRATTPAPEKSLEDLRSVLQGMVKDSPEKSDKEPQKSDKPKPANTHRDVTKPSRDTPQTKSDKPAPEVGLKEALASALKEQAKVSKPATQQPDTLQQQPQTPASTEPVKQTAPQQTAVSEVVESDPLDPKVLKKMIKTTPGERSPYQ
ncbi:MAG: type IV secretion system DNA-binding domain-containing protein [Patescibacteria group bacterium]